MFKSIQSKMQLCLSRFKLHISCFILLLKNLILLKTLIFSEVTNVDKVIIEGNYVDLFWKVKGCHKIEIKGIGKWPGSIKGLRFIYFKSDNPLTIIFYGIANKIEKEIPLKTTKIKVLDNFYTQIKVPKLIGIPFNNYPLNNCNVANIAGINLPRIQILDQHLVLKLEPYSLLINLHT
ncbi:MAG: hypothetical protein R2730_10475 [Chitinophagales bacterium]